MGSEMAQLFAEIGLHVSAFDVAGANVDSLLKHIDAPDALAPDVRERIKGYKDYDAFVGSLGGKEKRKLFLFSIKHGDPSDEVRCNTATIRERPTRCVIGS
jgi:6-phosphogluconate dehydrogenase